MSPKIFTISNTISAIVGLITAVGALLTAISQFPGVQTYIAKSLLSGNDNVGLIAVFRRSNDFLSSDDGRIKSYIENTKKEIWFFGTSFYISIPAFREDILKKLDECVDINFISLNPDTVDLAFVARTMGYDEKRLQYIVNENIGALIDLQEKRLMKKFCSRLSIRLTVRQFTSRIYMFDPKEKTGITYLIPQIYGKDSTALPGFLLSNDASNFHQEYFDGIRSLATDSSSISLEDWLKNHPEFLEKSKQKHESEADGK